MRRTVIQPLLTSEVEPGDAVKLALALEHPFAKDAELEPLEQILLDRMVDDPEGLYIEREIIYARWKAEAERTLPEAWAEIQAIPDQRLRGLYSKRRKEPPKEPAEVVRFPLYRLLCKEAQVVDSEWLPSFKAGMQIVRPVERPNRWQPKEEEDDLLVSDLTKRAWESRNNIAEKIYREGINPNT
jgi:hypothetical protein